MRGDRLKALRESAHISQEDLAERLGVSEIQVYRHENGVAEPRADIVVKYAECFNVSTDFLLGVSDEPGMFYKGDLTGLEKRVVAALRRGEAMEAIKMIASDE